MASAGDVDGDGYSDVIIAAFTYDNGQFDEGRVQVYHGSATGLAVSAAWITESDQADAGRTCSVASWDGRSHPRCVLPAGYLRSTTFLVLVISEVFNRTK